MSQYYSCTKDSTGYVNCIVIAEIYWVLESCYKYTYDQIAYAMETLIKCPQLEIESIDAVWNALNAYKKNRVDFSDALIGEINITKNCSKTVTLDKQASQLSTFSIL